MGQVLEINLTGLLKVSSNICIIIVIASLHHCIISSIRITAHRMMIQEMVQWCRRSQVLAARCLGAGRDPQVQPLARVGPVRGSQGRGKVVDVDVEKTGRNKMPLISPPLRDSKTWRTPGLWMLQSIWRKLLKQIAKFEKRFARSEAQTLLCPIFIELNSASFLHMSCYNWNWHMRAGYLWKYFYDVIAADMELDRLHFDFYVYLVLLCEI